ncbi:PA14 domain-containing protein [Paenibacillus sp. UNC496MF]|uniref:PA14 domain-containing protein n=1 Tax=Paenibacillus sp. UNC496MF TaxID=1502753 RepID=UPI0008F3A15E|nr:PA14 domain-containing protein [Paenibacillus sp. UNC496MF]SFJ65825.1 PA14 domain-containing protein [Paenibacillus sp. UNC496MF]
MAILNFDYKLQAVIRPIISLSFHYEVIATVKHGDGSQQDVCLYRDTAIITNWNDSLAAGKKLTDLSTAMLGAATLAELQATDPDLLVEAYYVWSPDTRVSIVCLPDGLDSPYAWTNALPQEDVNVETDWINGPQIDTLTAGSPETQLPVSGMDIKPLISRNSLTPMPADYTVIQLEATSSNDKIVLTYSDKLYAYGLDISDHLVLDITPETTSLQLVVGLQQAIRVDMETKGAGGVASEALGWKFDEQKVARVISFDGSQVMLEGIAPGTTNLMLRYDDFYAKPIAITVVDPKGRLTISRSQERAFVGDTVALHVAAEYENGDRFAIQLSTLTLTNGNAFVEKVSETDYKITPQASDILSFDLLVRSDRGEEVAATVKVPVWNKQLYRFHTLPETSTLVVGQELTVTAFYDVMFEDMGHVDSAITWDIVQGEEIASISSRSGKGVTIKALSAGDIQVRATAYGSQSITTITAQGQMQPILNVTPASAHIAPGQSLTFFAQVLNGDAAPVTWEVQDNGIVQINKQTESALTLEGVVNGSATIMAKAGSLAKQVVVTVSEEMISIMATPDPLPADGSSEQTYFPAEDTDEQWSDPKFESNYVDGKGFSTTLYGRSHGSVDMAHAIKSGIGDHDDLMVKKPQHEVAVQSFQYAARLRGKRKHQILIYPELNFQYSIWYKGDLYVTYNESPYKIGIDAYPPKKFGFTIKEDRMLPIQKEYEINMEIAGAVGKKTLEWAVNYEAFYEVQDQGDVKDLFTSSAGDYVGYGSSDVWKKSSDGKYIYDNSNRMCFSGIIAKGAGGEYYGWDSYEVEFDFKTIGEGNPDPTVGPQDDDVIGIIFKAKDKRNFYMMIWESDYRVKGSNRIGANIDGTNIFTADETVWNDGNHMAYSRNYLSSDSLWSAYQTGTGWKTQHRRIYKVTDGKMYKVNATDLGGGNGWDYQTMESMKVRCTGKHAEIFVRHSLTEEYAKVFEFDTDWENGAFGACNWSQAVEFHGIRVKHWIKFTGREPQTGWAQFDEITPSPKTINPSSSDYIKVNLLARMAQLGVTGKAYTIGSISAEVKDSTAGAAFAGVGQPVTVKTFNSPNAGTTQSFTYTKKGTFEVTPDNIDNTSGAVVFEDIDDFFRAEKSNFLASHADLSPDAITATYTIVKPASSDTEFAFENNKKLIFWHGDPEHVITEKTYEYSVYAYDGWVAARDLKEFVGGKWATYTLTLQDSGEYTIDPAHHAWKWAKAGTVTTHHDPTDVLMLKTTEWYQGTFPADIKNEGVANSDEPTYVDVPPNHEHYVDPYTGAPMPAVYANVHYVLHKYPVGKLSFLWMYWESKPGQTTRNTSSSVNVITSEPLLFTDRQNDRVVIKCDADPRYVPWISGKYIGQGKVNGKRPFFSSGAGKANMVDVPTDTVFLPPNLTHIEGPFIETDNENVTIEYDTFKKTVNFMSDYQDAYVWYTDWYTDWVEDPRSFYADNESVTTIGDTISINPMLDPNYDENVFIEKIEAISSNPFVSVWLDKQDGDTSGLLGTYYRYPLQTKILKESFVVGGDYHVKEQLFTVQEAVAAHREDGEPAREVFLAGQAAVRGRAAATEQKTAHTIYVPAGESSLKILTSFMQNTGDTFPDMIVHAPNGETFGITANNGTWAQTAISKTIFENGNLITAASKYDYSGGADVYELMTFTRPIEGSWMVEVYNQGITDTDYAITSNIGNTVQQQFYTDFAADPWNVQIKVNGISITDFVVDDKRITLGPVLLKTDLLDINYTAGGYQIDELPMQSTFSFNDLQPFTILSVQRNGVEIPQSSTEGYTVDGQQFQLHGSYVTPGDVKVRYATGSITNLFELTQDPGLGVTVYLNGVKLDPSKYSLSGRTLVVDRSMLNPKDWIHVQSYEVTGSFDPSKANYLGDVQFSRVDARIDFNWGSQSPFVSTEPVGTNAAAFTSQSVILDQMSFNLNVDLDISYPSDEVIDISNFTGEWIKFDENVGADVGDWHGPPEDGYSKVTNLANQSYRSGFFNPNHRDFTDYTFSFKVQEVASGDDDMYGAIFRFDPGTLNFYSFEMDAYWSRNMVGGTDAKGMGIYRNICLNPSQYGVAKLQYTKVMLAHLDEGWTFGADETNEIKVKLVGRSITVWVNGTEKFSIVDSAPDAILKGAWGPVTASQPKTYFWDFKASRMLLNTFVQSPGQRHTISAQVDRPITDSPKTLTVIVKDISIHDEFLQEINNFLAAHPGMTEADISCSFKIMNDASITKTSFDKAAAHGTLTIDGTSRVVAEITTKPASAPDAPDWSDYRHLPRTYLDPNAPLDVYTPDLPEPYIAPIQVPASGSPSDGFAISWRGNIYAPTAGLYQFHSTSDDGFRLWVNRVQVIDAWRDEPDTNSGSINLEGGRWYEISATYYENTGSAMVKLEWTQPGGTKEIVPSSRLAPFLGYAINAQVRSAAPLPWNPMLHNGYYYFQEKEQYLFAEKIRLVKTPVDQQILISPRPQQGAAFIVRDNEGNNLRKVAFFEEVRNAAGLLTGVNQTLENIESMSGNGYAKYYLQYKAIDPDTLVVTLNGITISSTQYIFNPKNSSIEFMNNLGFDDIMEFRYKLLYSFYVDYNYDVENDVARIVLHNNYDPTMMQDMEIIYEGAKDTPFYRAEEVSFNPILNHNHRGFLCLTNKVDQDPKVLEISISPKSLPAGSTGKVLVTGRALDKYNNPIQNKEVDIYRDGELMFSGKTNRAGEVYLYDQPIMPSDNITNYQIVCADLSNMEQLSFYAPNVANRVYLEMKTSKAVLLAGQNDEATITITLRDENWGVLTGKQIRVAYKDTKGVTRSFVPTTDDYGQTSITISGLSQEQGVFAVTATCTVGAEESSNFIFLKVIGA